VNSSFPSLQIPAVLYIDFAFAVSRSFFLLLLQLQDTNIEEMYQYVEKLVFQMTWIDYVEGHIAFKFLQHLTFTTYGSALASSSIGENNEILPVAFNFLSDGLNSDVSSGRLKLASVFFSIGEMEKAEEILRQTEQKYHSHPVHPICSCIIERPLRLKSVDIKKYCNEHNENCIKHITAFCVRFIRQEINCVPHELQYELFRSTQDDMIHRGPFDLWMELAVVDSLPFLYFLQYRIYSHLQRQQEKQQALNNLIRTTFTEKNLKHRETTLNILGQCMEQENRPQDALQYYIRSLHQRARNNAASIHICLLLTRLLVAK
jgi:tetratricopeptide (TPR) repeat protein